MDFKEIADLIEKGEITDQQMREVMLRNDNVARWTGQLRAADFTQGTSPNGEPHYCALGYLYQLQVAPVKRPWWRRAWRWLRH